MIKKLTAYSCILFAYIVLLAHAVLPHHHHEQQICIERTHCDGDEEAHIIDTPEKDHQHDGNTHSTICVLKQVVVIPSSQARYVNNCFNCTVNHNHDFFIFSNFGYEELQPVSVIVATVPEFPSFLISFLTTSLGLRAPPIV